MGRRGLLAERLRAARRAQEVTQEKAAELIGVSRVTLARWGNRRLAPARTRANGSWSSGPPRHLERSFNLARKRSTFGRILQRKGRPGFYVRFRLRDREVTRWAGPTRKIAAEFLADLMRKTAREELLQERAVASVSFRDFKPTLLAHFRARHAQTTVAANEGRLDTICTWFGPAALKDITAGDVQSFLSALREGGVPPNARKTTTQEKAKKKPRKPRPLSVATVNRYASLLSVAFKLAKEHGMARENPALGLGRPKEAEKAVPFISNADVDRLVAEARDARFGAMLRVYADTGLRRGEALALEWSDVDLQRGTLLVRRSKNGKPRQVELTEAARAAFSRLLKDRAPVPMIGPNLVWPEWAGLRPQAVSSRFRTVANRAGFDGLRLHDLRHGFCSRLAQAGVPLATISALAGHTSWLTTRRYASHLPEGATRAAIRAMEKHAPEPAEGLQVAT